MYRASETFEHWLSDSASKKFPLFDKFREIGSDSDWLRAALRKLNKVYGELGITDNDFAVEAEDQWEPIPLDRSDPLLEAATEKLDVAIEAIESDNGYAIHHPGERDHVLAQLKIFADAVKTRTQVYWPQVKTYAIDPLTRVVKRFGDAAVGVAAFAARQAIVDWLKANFAKVIGWLFW
jgi:hypothetical protein